MAQWLGKEGLNRIGKEKWQRAVRDIVGVLKESFGADYVILGGGNAKEIDPLPEGARRGGNENAFEGGFRLWQTAVKPADQAPAPEVWRVVY